MSFVSEFVKNQKRLLELEKQYDVQNRDKLLSTLTNSQLQQRGLALLKLKVSGSRTGLGGKTLVELEANNGLALPTHKLRNGDIVKLEPQDEKKRTDKKSENAQILSGVVYKVTDSKITVAFKEESLDLDQGGYRLVVLANETSYKRMHQALDLLDGKGKELGPIQVLFKQTKPYQIHSKLEIESNPEYYYNKNLNKTQIEAVHLALNAHDIAFIHGPPGTGKTMTLVEIIQQLAIPKLPNFKSDKPLKILVCASSNIAVDNLVERLLQNEKLRLTRIGHPARLLESVLHASLDYQIQMTDDAELILDVRKEMDQILSKLSKKTPSRRELYAELKTLRKEYRQREEKVVSNFLGSRSIVCCTLNGAGQHLLSGYEFDIVVIDESTQALEAECLIALLKGKKTILAGDPCQLPPVVQSKDASDLSFTLFDRMNKMYHNDPLKEKIMIMLVEQYRMNNVIMGFSSKELYENRLIAHSSVRDHLLCDLKHVKAVEETKSALMWIDTTGTGMLESVSEESDESKFNQGEVDLVLKHVELLFKAGLRTEDIAVISPYNAQVALLNSALKEKYPGLEIGSVDGFQGREKEAIVISLVRSNDSREIGFLSDVRRMNVAITRARRHCCIIGDGETVSSDSFYERLYEYVSEHGEVVLAEG